MFDLRRFLRLATVQWAEHGRAWLWFLGIGIAVHLCIWLLITSGGKNAERYDLNTQETVYFGGYVITGSLFALRYFSVLSDRESALTWLMRPASAFEKFLLAFLVVAVLYPLVYTLAFQICNLPGAWIGETMRDAKLAVTARSMPPAEGMPREYLEGMVFGPYLPFTHAQKFTGEIQLLLATTWIQALILAGTLYFRKVAWLKTLVALFALLVLAIPLLSVLTGASSDVLFWDETRIQVDNNYVRSWLAVLWIGMPTLFWASVFFFLRERELQ